MNEFCNEYRIPNKNRIKLFRKEMEYISLYIHDVLPMNYNEQGIHPNDCSISKHTKFFSRDDSLPVARKKWHDYILRDYNYFWDFYSHKINFRTLSDLEIVKLQDIYEIIYFMNPEGIHAILGNPETNSFGKLYLSKIPQSQKLGHYYKTLFILQLEDIWMERNSIALSKLQLII